MSQSRFTVEEYINLTKRTDGRDKIYRTIQYASRFLAWCYIRKSASSHIKRPVEMFQNLESMMSVTRKGMRLGRFIDFTKSLMKSFQIPNKRISTIVGLIATCQGLFMFIDNLLLLNRFKVIHLTQPDRLQRYLHRVWLLWLSLALTRDYYEIQAKLAVGQHGQQKQDRTLARRANIFWTEKPLVIDTVKNLCDIYLPLSNLNIVTPSPALQGIAGTISSIMGLLQIWDAKYVL